MTLDQSTSLSDSFALDSYLTFCTLHHFPIEPTADTLSFYVTYESAHTSPASVDAYLSGICNQLEPFFPTVRANRASQLVCRTLEGARRRYGGSISRKEPLAWEDLRRVSAAYAGSTSHNDYLFECLLLTGFCALLRLGELTVPDAIHLRDFSKCAFRSSCSLTDDHFEFWLPHHKPDVLSEGTRVVVLRRRDAPDPLAAMRRYLSSRDRRFPLHPWLWMTDSGSPPTRAWFIARLRRFFPSSISGHSMRAGGAMAMAEGGAAPDLIKAAGRWSSNDFERYIQRNPCVMYALIFGGTSSSHPA